MKSIEWIIYGTAWKQERTAELVEKAVLTGFRGIDTACQPKHYNEPQVGEALKCLASKGITREQLYLQTKYTPVTGQDPATIPYNRLAPVCEQVEQSISVSLENLCTDYIDTYILHSPLDTMELTIEAWRAMEGVVRSGRANRIGISNCSSVELLQVLYEVAEIKPEVVQNRFYAQTGYDSGVRGWCGIHGLAYQAFWTLTANPQILSSSLVRQLALRYGRTEPEIFFKFLVQSGIVVLTGTCNEQHMKEDLTITQFSLNSDEMKEIDHLLGPD